MGDLFSFCHEKSLFGNQIFCFVWITLTKGFCQAKAVIGQWHVPKDQGEVLVASEFVLAWLGSQKSPDISDVTSDHWILPNEHLQHIQCFRLSIWNHFMMLEYEEKTWCHQVILYDFLGLLILTRTQRVKLVSSQRKDKQRMVRWSSNPPTPNHQFTTIVG